MMLPTHVLVGLAMAAPALAVAPEVATPALIGGAAGGTLPDLDMYAGHRRTLHFPTAYTVAAALAAPVALLATTPVTVAVAFLLAAAAVHCRMDRYGGGLELRPWEATSEEAVYDHVRGRWRAPKRWIRYDGAPEDLLVTAGLGVPLYAFLDPPFAWVVVAAIGVGVAYTAVRRLLPRLAEEMGDRTPDEIRERVPERFRP